MSGEAKHASVKLYWIFAAILCFITFCEWAIFAYREEWGVTSQILVPALLAMSIVKFAMVVGWYMHLRYDHSWLLRIFVAALVMAAVTGIVLAILVAPT